jgi:hypothetical protein
MNRARTRGCAATAAVLVCLALAGFAAASCPKDQTVRCNAFKYRARGHAYRPHQISIELNGRPKCAYAQRLIKTWLRNRGSRIRDPSGVDWILDSRNPYRFTAGLCGVLIFRL